MLEYVFLENDELGLPSKNIFPHFFFLNRRRPTMAIVPAINKSTTTETNHSTTYLLFKWSDCDNFRKIQSDTR